MIMMSEEKNRPGGSSASTAPFLAELDFFYVRSLELTRDRWENVK